MSADVVRRRLRLDSRMKDFYDLWMLARTLEFDGQALAEAFTATFRRRGTRLPVEPPVALTAAFAGQAGKAAMLQSYRSRLAASGVEAPSDLADALAAITEFVMPPAEAAANMVAFRSAWRPGEGWSPVRSS